jgi:hypothetical protein
MEADKPYLLEQMHINAALGAQGARACEAARVIPRDRNKDPGRQLAGQSEIGFWISGILDESKSQRDPHLSGVHR